jgi:hypothetical protein
VTDSYVVPALVGEGPCFALDSGTSAECQIVTGDQFVPAFLVAGYNPPVFYVTMRQFVGPDPVRSVLSMRIFNVLLALTLWTLAFILGSPKVRMALTASWLVLLTPIGLFFIPSTNPSSWAIISAGLFWAFVYTAFDPGTGNRSHKWLAVVGSAVTLFLGLGSRSDTAFALLISFVAVAVLVLPLSYLRRLPVIALMIGASVLAAYTILQTRLGLAFREFLFSISVPSNVSADQPNAIVKLLLEIPAFLTGMVGGQAPLWTQRSTAVDAQTDGYSYLGFTYGVGWTDTIMPAAVSVLILGTAPFLLIAGTRRTTLRKGAVLLLLVIAIVGVLVFHRAGEGFTQGNIQPRYYYPIILSAFGIVLAGQKVKMSRIQTLLLMSAVAVASMVALRAALGRYVHGQNHSYIQLQEDQGWWWSSTALGADTVWLMGVGATATLAICSWTLMFSTRTAGNLTHDSKAANASL